jgi:hypothetical protein
MSRLIGPKERQRIVHQAGEREVRRLPAGQDGALQVGREEGETDEAAPPRRLGRRVEQQVPGPVTRHHRMRLAERSDHSRVRPGGRPIAGGEHGPPAMEANPDRQRQTQTSRIDRVGLDVLAVDKPAADGRQISNRHQDVQRGRVDLDPDNQAARLRTMP